MTPKEDSYGPQKHLLTMPVSTGLVLTRLFPFYALKIGSVSKSTRDGKADDVDC